MNYQTANEKLNNGRRKDARKLENNTYLERRDNGDIAVRLHSTDVLTFHPDGSTTVKTGDWYTVTTKDRINEYADNFRVWSTRGVWQIARVGDWDNAVLYADGMTIPANGKIVGESVRKATSDNAKLSRMIAKYIKGYVKHIADTGEIPQPTNGDCFGCLFSLNGAELPKHGRMSFEGAKAQDVMGVDHLLQHMEENYFVPSLLFLAAMEHAPRNWQFRLSIDIENAKNGNKLAFVADDLRYYFRSRKVALLQELRRNTENDVAA